MTSTDVYCGETTSLPKKREAAEAKAEEVRKEATTTAAVVQFEEAVIAASFRGQRTRWLLPLLSHLRL